jgi:hypothetical protein
MKSITTGMGATFAIQTQDSTLHLILAHQRDVDHVGSSNGGEWHVPLQ